MPPAIPLVIAYVAANLVAGAAVGAGLIALGTVAFTATYFGTMLAVGYLASKAFGPKAPKTSGALGDRGIQTNYRDPAAARRIIYGRQKVGGPYVFIHASGDKNEILHLIVPLASHEINAVEQIFFGSDAITYDAGTGEVGGRFAGFARVRIFTGTTTQAASSELIAECPDVWSSAHRLRGIAYVYVRLVFSQKVWTDGIPSIVAIVQGRKVYDPRTTTTVYSTNSALCLRDYLADPVLGLGITTSEMDETSFIAAANLCDENVSLTGGGTEKRYTTNTLIDSSARPEDVIGQLLSASGGILTYSGGLWTHHAAGWRAPTLTLTQDHLAGPISIATKLSARDRCNGVKGTFISEANQWQTADFPPVVNATYLSQDNGVRSWRDMPLPCTLSTATAQRLAKIELEKTRQEISCTLLCNLNAIGLRCGDVVNVTLPRYGWTAKPFEVASWTFVQDGEPAALMISLSLRETAAGIYDWSSGEETAVDLAPNTSLPNSYVTSAPSALALTSTATTQADGTTISQLAASWTLPTSIFWSESGTRQVLEYQINGDAGWTPWATVPGDVNSAALPGMRPGVSYRARIRSENTMGATSAWVVSSYVSAAGDTTAPSAPTSLVAEAMVQGIRIYWANPTAADFARIDVFEASAVSPAPIAGTTPSFQTASDSFVRSGLAIGATRYYWVRSVDATGNASAWTGPVSATANAVDASWINGLLASAQIDSLAASKVTGQMTDAQVAALSAAKITGTLSSAQIADLAAAKLTGQIVGTQITDGSISSAKVAAGAVTAGKIAAGTIVAADIAANAITASRLAITPDNLNPDPFFFDTAGWLMDGGGWVMETIYNGQGGAGPSSGRLNVKGCVTLFEGNYTGTARKHVYRDFESLAAPGTTLRLSAKGRNGGNQSVYSTLQIFDAASVPLAGVAIGWAAGAGASYQYVPVVVPANARIFRIWAAYQEGGTAWSGTAEIGDVRIDLMADASLIVDGAIIASKVAANAITAVKIEAGAIVAGKIAAGAIVAGDIAAGAIVADKLAANSVTANKVGTNEIVATSANIANGVVTNAKIANAAIDTAKIGDLQVSTLKIANNAVTIPVSAFTAGAITSFTTNAWNPIQSATIVSTGAPIILIFGLSCVYTGDLSGAGMPKLRVLRGATVIWSVDAADVGYFMPTFLGSTSDTPGAGTFTYTFQYWYNSTTVMANSANRVLHLLETKK